MALHMKNDPMTKRRLYPLILSLGMLILVLVTVFSVTGYVKNTDPVLHLEDPGRTSVTEYDALQLYRLFFGEDPPAEAMDYLDHSSSVKMLISDEIPFSQVHAEYDGAVLHVTAKPYSYTASGGTHVSFLPTTITVGETVLTLEEKDGVYEVSTPLRQEEILLGCTVGYEWHFTAEDAFLSLLLNDAFQAGNELLKAEKSYEDALLKYESDLEAYQNYAAALEAYNEAYAAYTQYQDEKKQYEKDLYAYERYLKDLKDYEKALQLFNEYENALAEYQENVAKYDQYLSDMKAYEQALKTYREAEEARAGALSKLYALESSYIKATEGHSAGRSMYETLMGDTVEAVVRHKDEIASVVGSYDGVVAAVDLAGSSTNHLKKLLAAYSHLETVDEKYQYYKEHYTEFCDHYRNLYSSLNHLFDNGLVKSKLRQEGRYERYEEFIAQLFVISTALDDSATLNPNAIVKNYAVNQLVFGELLLQDTNTADPRQTTLPPSVPKPDVPTEVKPQRKPTEVKKPTPPTPVDHPGDAPTAITLPTRPTPVKKPALPVPPTLTAEEQALLEAIRAGKITEKTYTGGDRTVRIETSVTVGSSMEGFVTVAYYDSDRKTLLYFEQIAVGDTPSYKGKLPDKEDDAYASYTFEGFEDANGVLLTDTYSCTENLQVFARYREDLNYYTVDFYVDGVCYSTECTYGSFPTCPVSTEKAADAQFFYTFSGWSEPLSRVNGDAVYTAIYETELRSYTVQFCAYGEVLSEQILPYGTMPVFTGKLSMRGSETYFESFEKWSSTVKPVTGTAIYHAVFERIYYGCDADGRIVHLTEEGDSLHLLVNSTTFVDSGVLRYAESMNSRLVLHFLGGEVAFSSDAVSALREMGAESIFLRMLDGRIDFRVQDAYGKRILTKTPSEIAVTIDPSSLGFKKAYEQVRLINHDTGETYPHTRLENGYLAFFLYGTMEIEVLPYEDIVLLPCENGSAFSDVTSALAGDTVTLILHPAYGYTIYSVKVYTASGEEIPVTDNTFVMPHGKASVSVYFGERTYEIRYLDKSGALIASHLCNFFDEVVPDAPNPPAPPENMMFTGWVKSGSPEDGLITFVAGYGEANYADPNATYKTDFGGWRLLPILLILLVVALIGGGAYYLMRRKKLIRKSTGSGCDEESSDDASSHTNTITGKEHAADGAVGLPAEEEPPTPDA